MIPIGIEDNGTPGRQVPVAAFKHQRQGSIMIVMDRRVKIVSAWSDLKKSIVLNN